MLYTSAVKITQISIEYSPTLSTHLLQPCKASGYRPQASPLQVPPPSQLVCGHQRSEQWRSSGSRHWRVDLKVRKVGQEKGMLSYCNGERATINQKNMCQTLRRTKASRKNCQNWPMFIYIKANNSQMGILCTFENRSSGCHGEHYRG